MAFTRRVFLAGVGAFLAFRSRPKPPQKKSVYSNICTSTY